MPICASASLASPVPCCRHSRAPGEALQRHVQRLLLDPDALAANRSSCSASTPTPILSAVLPIASAALIER
jgi:hypothetical protein